MQDHSIIPQGFCQCGCGERTEEPTVRFLSGHYRSRAIPAKATGTCPVCGRAFEYYRCIVARGRGQFCSRACSYASRKDPVDTFWHAIEKDADPEGCWIWKRGINSGGYGSLIVQDKVQQAHRFSYELHYGPIPDGMFVCHRCDTRYPVGDTQYRRCVRPDHLFLGTPGDNMRDMMAKGRAATGERNGAYTHPDRRPSGDRHGCRKHPEALPHGDAHWTRRYPGRVTWLPPHPRALTYDQATEIRQRYIPGTISTRMLAKEYKVSHKAISDILKGLTYINP